MEQFIYSSVFKDLTKETQIRFDAVSRLQKRLFDYVMYEKYLDWDYPSIGLDFNAIKGQYNISIAAATIDDHSKEPVIGSEGLETLTDKVLHHAITKPMRAEDYRKVLQIIDSKSIPDDVAKAQLIDLMFGNVLTPVAGVQAKLDMILCLALSNEGVATLDAENNPEGGVRASIDYGMPEENKLEVTTDWTDANIDTVDTFDDIQSVIDASQDKTEFSEILLAPSKLSFMLKSKNLKRIIFGSDKSSSILTPAKLNEYMMENNYPVFVPVKRKVRVQNGRNILLYSPWNEKSVVFIPKTENGKIGVIKNALTDGELRPTPGVTYSKYVSQNGRGGISVAQWGVGEPQNSNGVEFTKAESYSLPAITEINGIYSLKVEQ